MKESMNRILNRIDLEFVVEHPEITLDLLQWLKDDRVRTKDYIYNLELLLAMALNSDEE